MKMTMLRDYKIGFLTLEKDNSYDSEKQGISDADAQAIYAAGCCEIEGHEPAPPPNINGKPLSESVTLKPAGTKHAAKAKKVGE